MAADRARWKGYGLALLAATLWASLSILGKLAYRYQAHPLTVVTLRAALAFFTLAGLLAVARPDRLRITRRDLPFLALYGGLGVGLNYGSYFYALSYTTVAVAIILLYTYPAIVVLLAALLGEEPLSRAKGVALVLTFGGCFLVAQGYDPAALRLNLAGVAWGLLGGFGAAMYGLLGKRALARHATETALLYALGFGGLALALWRGPALVEAVHYPPGLWAILLAMAWLPTLVGYGSFLTALHYVEAGRASITATVEPVLATALSYLFLGETLEPLQGVGGLLVLAGVVLIQLR